MSHIRVRVWRAWTLGTLANRLGPHAIPWSSLVADRRSCLLTCSLDAVFLRINESVSRILKFLGRAGQNYKKSMFPLVAVQEGPGASRTVCVWESRGEPAKAQERLRAPGRALENSGELRGVLGSPREEPQGGAGSPFPFVFLNLFDLM